jgi:hypothetical protein
VAKNTTVPERQPVRLFIRQMVALSGFQVDMDSIVDIFYIICKLLNSHLDNEIGIFSLKTPAPNPVDNENAP